MKNGSTGELILSFLLAAVPAPGVVAAQTLPEVAVTGSISSRSIQEDEHLQFTLVVKNKADAKSGAGSVTDVTLINLPATFKFDEKEDVCVFPILVPHTKQCETLWEFSAAKNVLAKELAPGQSLTVQGFLKPDGIHKPAALTAIVGWSVATKTQAIFAPSSQSVTLGESQVLDSSWWRGDEGLKVLGIPALLLLIGGLTTWAFNSLNVWREARAAKAQAKLEEVRHKAEEYRAVRAETWKQMLPVSHNYAAKFYLPLSLAAERLVDNLKSPNPRLAFFYLLFAAKKMIATRNEIGGFYFKDLRGESLAAQCWKKQRLACLGTEDSPFYLSVFASVEQIAEIESFEEFEKTFAENPGGAVSFSEDCIQKAWLEFQTWLTKTAELAEMLQYLEGFYSILDFESNRPYQYWYDPPGKLNLDKKLEPLLRNLLKADGYNQDKIDEYFKQDLQP